MPAATASKKTASAPATDAATESMFGYPVHPAAALFPMMDDESLGDLAKDIKSNGLIEPIMLLDGAIIDGRNRLKACEKAKVEPTFVNWRPLDGESAVSMVLSRNLHRRHLTTSQRAALAVDIEPLFAEEAKQRALAGARRGGAVTAAKRAGVFFSDPEVATPTKTGTGGRGIVDPFAATKTKAEQAREDKGGKNREVPAPAPGGARARDQAAKAMGVSSGYVSHAKKVAKEDPEVFEKVKTGEISLAEARRQVDPTLMKQFLDGMDRGIKKEEKPKAPRRTIKVSKPRNGKVVSSKVTLQLTVTFGSAKVAADVLQILDDDPRVLSMDHETI